MKAKSFKSVHLHQIDQSKQDFFKDFNIDTSLIEQLDRCVSNDIVCNKVKKIINDKIEKLIILNESIKKNTQNTYITNEFIKQMESFNKLISLGHNILT